MSFGDTHTRFMHRRCLSCISNVVARDCIEALPKLTMPLSSAHTRHVCVCLRTRKSKWEFLLYSTQRSGLSSGFSLSPSLPLSWYLRFCRWAALHRTVCYFYPRTTCGCCHNRFSWHFSIRHSHRHRLHFICRRSQWIHNIIVAVPTGVFDDVVVVVVVVFCSIFLPIHIELWIWRAHVLSSSSGFRLGWIMAWHVTVWTGYYISSLWWALPFSLFRFSLFIPTAVTACCCHFHSSPGLAVLHSFCPSS